MLLASLILRLVPFGLILLGSWWMTRRLCRSILGAKSAAESGAGWFGFAMASERVRTFCWFGWLVGVLLLDPWNNLAIFLGWGPLVRLVFHNACTVLPPAIMVSICEVMTFPVLRNVRGLDLPWKRLAVDAFFGRLWLALPATIIWIGFRGNTLGRSDLRIAMLFLPVGLILWLVFQALWRKRRVAVEFTPQALSTGELRDRAFAMAGRAGVKLNQIYVYPMAKWKLANAYANEGNNLLLTDWLLRHLNVREIDAVIGHELAHMKRGHVSKQSWVMVLFWLAPFAWFKFKGVMPDLAIATLCILGSLHVAGWLHSILSRQHEREADLDGVQISGDAEAFISALRKLDELNAMPGELNKFEQALSTHPATRKRIDAITQAAQGFSQAPPTSSGAALAPPWPSYNLPQAVEAATQGDPPVFDSTIKSRIVNRFTMAYMVGVGLPPLLIAVLADWFEPGPAMVVFWIAGVASYLLLLVWMTNCVGRGLLSNLRSKVEERLSRIHGRMPADAIFVGLSPGADVRVYEGCYSWDVGFLSLQGGQLCYVGEQARFALARNQVRQVRLGAGAPRWSKSQRVYIDWEDPASARQGSFALSCADQKSFSQDAKACEVLAREIQDWHQNGAGNYAEAGFSAELPMFGEVTSHCPRTQMSFGKYLSTLLLALAIPIGLGAGAGLHRENLLNTGLAFLCIVLGHTFVCLPIWRLKPLTRAQVEMSQDTK